MKKAKKKSPKKKPKDYNDRRTGSPERRASKRAWSKFVGDLLDATGWSGEELGRMIGRTKYCVSKWKLGKRLPLRSDQQKLREIAEEHNRRVEEGWSP